MSAAVDYTPREGTLAHKVIHHLVGQGEGAQISSPEIGALFQVKGSTIASHLATAIKHGALVLTKEGRSNTYSLPDPATVVEPGGALLIAAYSDGDVSVQGGQRNEDGSTTYTRGQMQQLLQFVTRAPVAMATGATE